MRFSAAAVAWPSISPNYVELPDQASKLDAYCNIKPYSLRIFLSSVKTTTSRGEELTLKLPRHSRWRGIALRKGACEEVNRIPVEERDAKLAAVADAYLLARQYVNTTKLESAGIAIGMPVTAACIAVTLIASIAGATAIGVPAMLSHTVLFSFLAPLAESKINARQTRKLMKSILVANDITPSDTLKKIDFSKMTIQEHHPANATPMRNEICKIVKLPINTRKTRTHLRQVFAGNTDRLAKLDNMLRDFSNYDHCPSDNSTDGGSLNESGWRKILELCLEPKVIRNVLYNNAGDNRNSRRGQASNSAAESGNGMTPQHRQELLPKVDNTDPCSC